MSMVYKFVITHCVNQACTVSFHRFADIAAATAYASNQWPKAIKLEIEPFTQPWLMEKH